MSGTLQAKATAYRVIMLQQCLSYMASTLNAAFTDSACATPMGHSLDIVQPVALPASPFSSAYLSISCRTSAGHVGRTCLSWVD